MNKLFCLLLSINSLAALALTPIEDESMALVSGQAGITVDIESMGNSHIGEVRYQDADGSTSLKAVGNTGSISLLGVDLSNTSFSFDIDVTDAALVFKLNQFAQTDVLINDIAFNYNTNIDDIDFETKSTMEQLQQQYNSIGSLGINDFTIANTADVSFKFGGDTAGNPSFIFSSTLSEDSYFYLTYTDDGEFTFDPNGDGDLSDNNGHNYISTKVTFDDFIVKDISFHGKDVNDQTYLEITLASLSGGIAFEEITINGAVLGTAGMENVMTDSVSYLRIQGK